MKGIVNFFNRLNPFKKVEQPKTKTFPCDFITCEQCVYFDMANKVCGISTESKERLNATYNESDIKRFIKK